MNKEITKVLYDNKNNVSVVLYSDGTYQTSSYISNVSNTYDNKNKSNNIKCRYTNIDDLINDLLYYNIVINVLSDEGAKEFVKVMKDKYNIGWYDNSYKTAYSKYKENTCYDFEYGENNMTYYNINFYKLKDKTIVPYSEVKDLLINS